MSTTTSSSVGGAGTGGTTGSTGIGGTMCVPVDDSNPCTDDVCENGVPVHNPTPAGSACSVAGTLCDGLGTCVECRAPADCAGMDDACQTRTCSQGKCGLDFAAAGTPLPMQIVGDCLEAQCDGAGATVQAATDTDLPDDMNPCTDDVCTAGVPSHAFTAQGSVCGAGLVCNAAGMCVGCNAPSDCAGVDDECKTRTCVAGMCGVSFTAAGTPVAAQTPGNCLEAACDGAGNIANIADDLDLPPDDGNPCTDEVCNAGMIAHPGKINGTVCTDGDACTVADTCQAGTCTSGAPVTCAALDQCHTAGTCNSATGVCSNPNKADGTVCNGGNACTQTDTCQAGTCAGANPVTCTALDQCHSAGTCAPATGVCSNPNKANGSACNDGNACTQTDTCQAGTCSGANPVTCAPLDQCHVAGSCNAGTGVCTNPNAANGTACTAGAQPGTCQTGSCVPSVVSGNGIIQAGETCDDGNTAASDGCSPTCTCEATHSVLADAIPDLSIVDDGYNGTLATMACLSIPVTAVAGCSATVTSVSVTAAINHTWIGDLVIKLVASDNTIVTLMSRPGFVEPADDGTGGAGDSSNLVSAFPITFVTGAAVSAEGMGNTITSAQNVCQNDGICSFAPANGAAAAGTLANFIGKPAAGTWKFCVGDSGAGDVGTINKVTLTLGQ